MHERMELKTHTLAVTLTTLWPMALAMVLMAAVTGLLLPLGYMLQVMGVMALVVAVMLLICVRMYLGTYLFLPATEYKGARIIARLGRSETEITGVLADEVIVKQNFIEKALGVCHMRQKGTAVYLRGVQEPERVKAWIAANFPQERPAPSRRKGKK